MEASVLSRVIWKQSLEQVPTQAVELPEQWRPLSFGNQQGTPVLWFEAEPVDAVKSRLVFLVFTGEPVPDKARYVGTTTFGQDGFIVVHCYVR